MRLRKEISGRQCSALGDVMLTSCRATARLLGPLNPVNASGLRVVVVDTAR